MELFLSAKIILGTFTASTVTTITICNLYNIPFFNPSHNRYQFYHNIARGLPVTIGILTQSIIVYSFLVHHFIENKPHTIIQNLENIIKYSILAEFIYYVYHRIIHTKDYYMTKIDSFFLITSLGLPLLVLRMNYFENIVALYIYITAAYFEHSNFYLVHHAKHHKLLFCNFCILNPIFDILVGTYRH